MPSGTLGLVFSTIVGIDLGAQYLGRKDFEQETCSLLRD
jgi:hypothetical protein